MKNHWTDRLIKDFDKLKNQNITNCVDPIKQIYKVYHQEIESPILPIKYLLEQPLDKQIKALTEIGWVFTAKPVPGDLVGFDILGLLHLGILLRYNKGYYFIHASKDGLKLDNVEQWQSRLIGVWRYTKWPQS